MKDRISAGRLALLVDKCRSCGSVTVFWNGRALQTVDLRASSTEQRRLITVARWAGNQTGTVSVRVTSRGKRLAIDGLGTARSL